MHDRQTVEHVLELARSGLSASAIARATGLARTTIRDWTSGRLPQSASEGFPNGCARGPACLREGPLFKGSYAYILGMYLGDGCISEMSRGVFSFRIFLDRRYPEIVFECRARLGLLCPHNEVAVHPMSGGAKGDVVRAYSKHWPCLFPQHGLGPKHARPIKLEPWQAQIVEHEPELFLRGLIHSDGCRNINNRGRDSAWQGVRYLFSNRSEDIRDLFCASCDSLGVHWTKPNVYTISIARRADTARLDEFIGPKR